MAQMKQIMQASLEAEISAHLGQFMGALKRAVGDLEHPLVEVMAVLYNAISTQRNDATPMFLEQVRDCSERLWKFYELTGASESFWEKPVGVLLSRALLWLEPDGWIDLTAAAMQFYGLQERGQVTAAHISYVRQMTRPRLGEKAKIPLMLHWRVANPRHAARVSVQVVQQLRDEREGNQVEMLVPPHSGEPYHVWINTYRRHHPQDDDIVTLVGERPGGLLYRVHLKYLRRWRYTAAARRIL